MDNNGSSKKITTFGLVTMIITAIFGFGNVSNAYLQMGYGSIIWYALAGILFFFPCGLMMAEYGSAFKEAKGGIYSWLAGSIGERWAFVGTFVWLASWIVWMVSTSSRIWITSMKTCVSHPSLFDVLADLDYLLGPDLWKGHHPVLAGDGPLVDGNDRDLGDHFNPGDHLLIVVGDERDRPDRVARWDLHNCC